MIENKNKNILITGGSSGIGKALAVEYISGGSKVILCARDLHKLNAAKDEIVQITKCDSSFIDVLSVDITDFDQTNQIIGEFLINHSVPDILINCAGVAHPGEFLDLDLDIFHWLMNTNYYGTVHMIKSVLPAMINNGAGHIVNISSAAGFLGVYGYTAYGATKYAVRGFSDALRAELKLKNINMSLVFPPDTDTPQLAYEEKYKPPITKALAGNAGVLSAESVAKIIVKNVAKGKYIIVPGSENAFLYHLSNILGKHVYKLMDFMIRDAAKKAN
ncbi:MAG: SDR family oxidoreductase [Anaerolineaceae bacterium]|nr:SDR family oxidoreductase [Anaerolineaceae bacterium]